MSFRNAEKPRSAGLCGRAVNACDPGVLTCSIFDARYDTASVAFDLTFGDLTGSAIGSAVKGISGLKAAKTAETIAEGAGDVGNTVKNLKPQNYMEELAQSGAKYTRMTWLWSRKHQKVSYCG